MSMIIKEITDKNTWEDFFSQIEEKTFLQSFNWGEFQKDLGEKVWRLGIYENELIAVCSVVKVVAKRGTFLLVSHPHKMEKDVLRFLIEELKKISEGCHFIRFCPLYERNKESKEMFSSLGFKKAPIHVHPELTWKLNLENSEEDLLKGMRKTTRYLIKQGGKNEDLEIIKSRDVKDIKIFNDIYQETVKRHHFHPFSLNYLEKEFLNFKDNAVIFLAKYKGEYIASSIVIFWSGIGFYHQGASSQKYPKIPASYLMQWQAILEARNRGCKSYNFWGIADTKTEEELKKHPWKGLTLFKKGFGGYRKDYLKTQDLPLSFRYNIIRLFEKIRKAKRRL